MKKVVAIIQARTGSTRFGNKILKTLYDKTLLEHIIERVQSSKYIDDIVVATTKSCEDDIVYKIAETNDIKCYRGSISNVLGRFYYAAQAVGADIIVRVTADDPFKDPDIIDRAIKIVLTQCFDYVSNTLKPTYPEGLDVEVFTFNSLQKAHQEAKIPSEKEHVTPYIWKNPEMFSLYNFENSEDLSYLRWTVDYESDYLFAKKIYMKLYPKKKIFHMKDVLKLSATGDALSCTTIAQRNEGYIQSIRLDEL